MLHVHEHAAALRSIARMSPFSSLPDARAKRASPAALSFARQTPSVDCWRRSQWTSTSW